eukprot:CAMPEP_0203637584 /NCGR_PEP_ID=MMETSP0088-20131115/3874_1 /ASSEMBLY_ACC=CAM_ASM_001087 /TAXON_ID=426623 /ORGANISM="Chaetoceros affinis, Strain CCMP159" /LENGTH=458 /DNA_ID=CAMNT_0050492053 /DNA_START=123 /DNA_END=1499 /DNA_ORIENTATION=-
MTRRPNTARMRCVLLTTIFVIGCITIHERGVKRYLMHDAAKDGELQMKPTYFDKEHVCANALPYAKMHDPREEEVAVFRDVHIERAGGMADSFDKVPPEYVALPPGSNVACWDCSSRSGECMNPTINARNVVKCSGWTSGGDEAFGDDDEDYWEGDPRRIWVSYKEYEFLGTKRTVIHGDAAAFFGFFPTNFGHCLHDNFPMVAFLRSIVPEHTKFILPNTEMYKKLLTFIDPSFVENRVYFFDANEIVTVEGGTLTVAKADSLIVGEYGNTLFRPLRHWIFENHPEHYTQPEDKVIVFHTRNSAHTEHGRVLEPQHEQDILALIRAAMEKYNRKEELVIFSGQDGAGNILPLEEQFDTFRRASTIIGPHGSGLANNIWTYPFPTECNERVQMLEFMAGSDTPQVQHPPFNGYYWVMRGMPIDWHQVLYAANSTRYTTWINLEVFKEALDDMWGSTIA